MTVDREFEGKDLEEALRSAAASLGIAEPDLDYRILEQGRRGLFGIGAKSVRIEVMPPVGGVEETPERPPRRERRAEREQRVEREQPRRQPRAEPRAQAQARSEERAEPPKSLPLSTESEEVRNTLQRMLELMGLNLTATARRTEAGLHLDLDGEDRKQLTQKDGELISALQFLLNRMARRAWPETGRIHLSGNGRRKQDDGELVELTREVAQQVSSTGQAKRLHPMNAYERRLVHITVREFEDLGSRSEGNGYLKRVRIHKNKGKSQNRNRSRNRRRNGKR